MSMSTTTTDDLLVGLMTQLRTIFDGPDLEGLSAHAASLRVSPTVLAAAGESPEFLRGALAGMAFRELMPEMASILLTGTIMAILARAGIDLATGRPVTP